ncbi:Transcription factor E [uncultured archaeon]|nr:Transcription factor E [uncultured archaeon]
MAKSVKKARYTAGKKAHGARKASKSRSSHMAAKKSHPKIKLKIARKIAKKTAKKSSLALKSRLPRNKLKMKTKLKAKPAKKQLKAAKKQLKSKITIQEAPVPVKRELSKDIIEILGRAQARQWLIELGGENTLEVIRSLPAVPSDEELAKKLKVKVSDVRASLNKLHNEGLVAYIRDKNSETGWYSYSWEINEGRIKRWVAEKHAASEAFRPREGVDLYFCKECGPESAIRFESASECLFKCPSCSNALDLLDEDTFEQFRKIAENKGR